MAFVALAAIAEIYSIPNEQLDAQKVFWGVTTGFEKAGEIDYDQAVKSTPEYGKLKKDKVERGSGKYWILMSQASERTTRAITRVGQDTEYDLIALQGYLGSLQPPIPADNITQKVVDEVGDHESKTGSKKAENRGTSTKGVRTKLSSSGSK
jgi:hypothetical protein